MKKGVSFKSMLMLIGLVTIAVPGILNVAACVVKDVKEEPEQTNPALSVVDAINVVVYQQEIVYGSKVEELKDLLTADFIKAKLTGEMKDAFQAGLFVLNKVTDEKGKELTDADLKIIGVISGKINYDYGKFTNQTTNLEINIRAKGKLLSDIFKDFEFKDEKGITNFLDTNNLNIITKQIETFLDKSLDEDGLSLENQQATSILLKAKPESKKYQGEITLTWNLKLFEIYGGTTRANNIWIQKGLKGYFYLEHTTNQIKYFNVLTYLSNTSSPINPKVDDYHKFSFKNQNNQEKNFTFNGKKWTTTIAESFDSFAFTKEVKVVVDSPELDKVKIFDAKTNNWKGLNKASTFLIDNLGQINELNLLLIVG